MDIESTLKIATSVIIAVVSAGYALIKWSLSRFIREFDSRMVKLEDNHQESIRNFNDFRLDAAKHYATQPSLEKVERDNAASHGTLHARIDVLAEQMTEVRTTQRLCKQCNNQ